jgi:ParB-like chromosome segregation protein Spo0J
MMVTDITPKDALPGETPRDYMNRKNYGLPKNVFATPAHPAAELFPMLPDDELRDLAASIKKHGLQDPIVVVDGKVLDGRNRLRACELAGVEPRFIPLDFDGSPLDYVLARNLHRRHLTGEQKREVIAKVLKLDPGLSNRTVAKQTRADDKTVGTVRKELEARAEIPHVAQRTDSKGRQQPAAKAGGHRARPDAAYQKAKEARQPEVKLSTADRRRRRKAGIVAEDAINVLRKLLLLRDDEMCQFAFAQVRKWIWDTERGEGVEVRPGEVLGLAERMRPLIEHLEMLGRCKREEIWPATLKSIAVKVRRLFEAALSPPAADEP